MVDRRRGGVSGAARDFGLPLVAVLLHLVTNLVSPYEIHRDEFLYAAMGRHFHLFGMDFPPLIAIIAQVERFLFGSTMFGLRLVPALCHGLLIYVTGRIALRLGGSRTAALLAGLTVLLSPLMLRAGNLFQPVVIDQLIWTLGYLLLAVLCERNEPGWWRWLGVLGGVGLLTKFSIGFFAVGALVALLASPQRKAFLTPHPWLAALIALLIGSPSIIGQVALGWPVRGQMSELAASQLQRVTPGALLGEQLFFGPMVWLGVAGLAALLVSSRLRVYRPVGVACIATTLLLLVLHGKAYYLGPIWPALAAAGAVWLEGVAPAWRRILVPAVVTVTSAFGLVIALPMGLPILPKATMAEYAGRIGITSAVRTNRGEVAPLPQDFADMLGWERFVDEVTAVWNSLPPGERATAVLAASNYGRAGALDWYGPERGLPGAICACGSYWFWGHGNRPGDVAVLVDEDSSRVAELFDDYRLARTVIDPWRVGEEQRVLIWVGRGFKVPLVQLWPRLAGNN